VSKQLAAQYFGPLVLYQRANPATLSNGRRFRGIG
jgi:hypothetical protein